MSRVAVAIASVVALAVVVALLGRWERSRWIASEREHIEAVAAAVGSSFRSPHVSGYRIGPPDCLFYQDGSVVYALELCWDRIGRLTDAVDRRGTEPKYWTLRQLPSAAPSRVDPSALHSFLSELEIRVQINHNKSVAAAKAAEKKH